MEVNLGSEWDEALLNRLRSAVALAGGTMTEASYGVGGSQEVVSYRISLPHGALEAVAETYAGLRLRGPHGWRVAGRVGTESEAWRCAQLLHAQLPMTNDIKAD